MASTSTKSKAKPASESKAKTTPRQVMLGDKAAKNRHFLLDKGLVKRATVQAAKDGLHVSDILRHGIAKYAKDAPSVSEAKTALALLPDYTIEDLREIWDSGDSDKATHFVAALHRGGWPTRAIADSIVASGAVEKFTRQAVSLRVLKAPEELRSDLPEVPELGPRRAIVSARKGQKGEYKPAKRKASDNAHDVGFRVEDEVYAEAARRAKHEGAMMSGVLDGVLHAYLSGEYANDKDLKKTRRSAGAV